jgi:hypothetical protein
MARRGRAAVLGAAVATLAALGAPVAHAAAEAPRGDSGGRATESTTAPTRPPVHICGNRRILRGPTARPRGAVVVPAGYNGRLRPVPNRTYWFVSGRHTLGRGQFDQIVPADHDVFVGAPGAVLDGQHRNRYAFTQHAVGVTIEQLTIQNFGAAGANRDEGVVNHDSGRRWVIRYNTIRRNAGAGVFIGPGDRVHHNCLTRNQQYGFSAYAAHGDANIRLDHNEISYNNTHDWERRIPGCGCTGGGKFWDTDGATVVANWVHDNHGPGLWADTNNNDFDFERNYISGNDAEGIEYEISYNALLRDNTFVRNALVAGPQNPGFPTPAVYLSESGGAARVPARYASIKIIGNRFVDNWSGVVLWENADRFRNSPANTSSGYCTLVRPRIVNRHTCVAGMIEREPYYSDCRWRTRRVLVADNDFVVHRARLRRCTPARSCGLQGIFSNYGSYPAWSPYKGERIERAITFHQHNVFRDNRYVGGWRFVAHDQGRVLGFRAWRSAPYHQDRGSSFH